MKRLKKKNKRSQSIVKKKTKQNTESSKGRTSSFELDNGGSIPSSVAKSVWERLKEAGFPQGGSGNYLQNPETGEKYYIPHPSEIYQAMIADPKEWEKMSEAMAEIWLEIHGR